MSYGASTRRIPVTVYMGDQTIGEGYIEYIDEAMPYVNGRKVARKITTPVYVGDTLVGYADLEYEDIVAQEFGGSRAIDVKTPVYLGDEVVGEMNASLIDTYREDPLYVLSISIPSVGFMMSMIRYAIGLFRGLG
ncbi:MAG: hypothetical protein C0179_05695 [Fervidicoccus sp.]|nr:MAG: hypothetical protein C0179_05695 [Fervidicoccus sp.]